jgi:hypothetical protein
MDRVIIELPSAVFGIMRTYDGHQLQPRRTSGVCSSRLILDDFDMNYVVCLGGIQAVTGLLNLSYLALTSTRWFTRLAFHPSA